MTDTPMRKYACFYQRQKIVLEANSLYGAKLKAIATFNPPKSQVHLIAVELLDEDGKIDIQRLN